jgi:hypothetical protein
MQICVNSWAPLDPSLRLKRDVDLFGTFGIFPTMLAGFAFAPGGEAAHSHCQRITPDRDRGLLVVINNERKLHSCVREKMLLAFCKIARSCCARSHARLSRWFSSSNGL